MHEIRVTLSPEHVAEAIGLAKSSGISRVTVTDVCVFSSCDPPCSAQTIERRNLHAKGAILRLIRTRFARAARVRAHPDLARGPRHRQFRAARSAYSADG